jgi:hypothetical protein
MQYKYGPMRTSSRKTTAAVLRDILQPIKVPEWAEILNRSPHTVHDLESGRLKLSPELATKMSYESGISIGWLLDGDPDAPAVSADGREYTSEIFDEVQARKKHFAHVEENKVKINALELFRVTCAILVNANRKRNFHLAAYRTWKAIEELRAEFGEARDFDSYEAVLAYVTPALALPVTAYVQDVPNLPALPLAATSAHLRNLQEAFAKFAQAQAPKPKPKSKRPSSRRRRKG